MGSSYKKAIFEEHIHEGLVGWALGMEPGFEPSGAKAWTKKISSDMVY